VTCTRWFVVLAVTAIVAGCGGGAPSSSPTVTANTATVVGVEPTVLGDGKIAALPAGTLYVQYLDIPQAVAGTITHAHIAGFVYTYEGTHRLAIQGGETKDLKASEAAFVPADVGHTHSNPGTSVNRWYFISIRPNTARTAPATFPGQKEAFATADLPAFPAGAYALALRFVTIQPNGRTSARKHGGLMTLLVLDGSVEIRSQGTSAKTLQKGEGTSIQADTPTQIWNKSPTPAKYLAFFVTGDGKTFVTELDTSP
jgi:quercetin dioxygenase-like cupin family protein